MKFIASVILVALLAYVSCLYLGWWSIALAAALVSILIHQRPLHSFLTGFIALFLLWGGLAWWIDAHNGHIMARRLAAVLPFAGSVFLMIFVTAFIGGLVAGLAAMAASHTRYTARAERRRA